MTRKLALPLALCSALLACGPAARGTSLPDGGTAEAPDSPRAALRTWYQLSGAGRDSEAAHFLELPARSGDALQLSRKLRRVLDGRSNVDPELASPQSEGDVDDDLGRRIDEVGRVALAGGTQEPVLLARQPEGVTPHWKFSRDTVARVDAWYATLDHRWMYDRLPSALLRVGPFDLLLWQWLAIVPLVVIAWIVGLLLGKATQAALRRVARKTATTWDDQLIERGHQPLTLAWTTAVAWMLVPLLSLYAPAEASILALLRSLLLIAVIWTIVRAIDVGGDVLLTSTWAQASPGSRGLVPLGVRVVKLVVLAFSGVAVLANLGYPVASLLAGLGIGGLALALAAQKTVENLFGAVSLGVDQPFRAGDFIQVDGMMGTVESLGLRSTRIRTLDRTVITIPNGKLADLRIESFALRDRFRLFTVLGLVYGTKADQIRAIVAGVRGLLLAHPKISADAPGVVLRALGTSALEIEVAATFKTADWSEFVQVRQELLLGFMDIIEKNGSQLAFPTQTVQISRA